MGKCQSVSNNFYPSNQSRKISIGITVEAPAKTRTEARKEGKVASRTMEKKVTSSQGKSMEADKDTRLKSVLKGKQAEVPDQETAAWFSTRSLYQETAITNTVQLYASRTSILQSSDGLHKKFDGVTYGRKTEKRENVERVEEFAFATTQKMHVSDKGAEGEKLETTSLKVEVKNLKSGKRGDCKGVFVKPWKNSDSIETDSESPNQNALRPFTHSLTQKKAVNKTQRKLQHEINKGVNVVLTSSCFKLKCPEKNVFAFDEAEGRVGILHWTANGSSSFCKRKKRGKRSTRIQAPRICLSRKPFCKKSLQSPAREKTPSPPEKTAPKVDTEACFHSPPSQSQNNKYSLKPKNLFLEEFQDSK
ncbi:meiosis-specific protein ASY3-like [Magnolia sinica]|uniref:meiosis-specific protein ASY3-like n=1 Tax=Magnolia sinica TaxID=86752 RepID=UPI00265AEE57|nr:meiosis-specific protein ASY3-like [Magnolia sinica]